MKKFSKRDLVEILAKKASGFYYYETVYEFEKTQNNSKERAKQVKFDDLIENLKNDVTQNNIFDTGGDIMKLSNEKCLSEQNVQNLTLSKKKITTHYIPPDMLAIKILFEIYGKKVGENKISSMSDENLIKLKNQLIEELKDENNKNL